MVAAEFRPRALMGGGASFLLFTVFMLHIPCVCRADAIAGDTKWTTWLRRAIAPSAEHHTRRVSLTSSDGRRAITRETGASAGTSEQLTNTRSRAIGSTPTASWVQVQRAFAPSSKTERMRASFLPVSPDVTGRAKLSRVSHDEPEPELEPEERWVAPPANAIRSMTAMRGGGVEHVFDKAGHSTFCAQEGDGRGEVYDASCSGRTGRSARSKSPQRSRRDKTVAFMHGDSGIIGSRGCNRDWKQLVQSTTAVINQERAGRLISQASRDRPFRLSRTVEVVEPSACFPVLQRRKFVTTH